MIQTQGTPHGSLQPVGAALWELSAFREGRTEPQSWGLGEVGCPITRELEETHTGCPEEVPLERFLLFN